MALYCTEIAAKTWISLSKGTKLLLYRKDHACSKLRPFHAKIIVCRSFIEEEEENGENRAFWPISYSTLATFSSYFEHISRQRNTRGSQSDT